MSLGGTCQVASSLKYLLVPAVVPGEGTRPPDALTPDLTNVSYVVSLAHTAVPSESYFSI